VKNAGYLQITVDTVSGKFYCGRKNGQHAAECKNTELLCFPLLGKLLYLHGHSYAICGQPFCGSFMELDRLGLLNRRLQCVIRVDERGMPCSRCLNIDFQQNATRLKKSFNRKRKQQSDTPESNHLTGTSKKKEKKKITTDSSSSSSSSGYSLLKKLKLSTSSLFLPHSTNTNTNKKIKIKK
jgi:hypothetical protein